MIVFVTTADTEILALSRVARDLPDGFPALKGVNPTRLPDASAPESLAAGASLVLVRLLGGRRAWEAGFDGLAAHCRRTGIPFLAWSGEPYADAELTAASTAPAAIVAEAFAYLCHGGVDNLKQLLLFLSDTLLMTGYGFEPPQPLPEYGIYHPAFAEGDLSLVAIRLPGQRHRALRQARHPRMAAGQEYRALRGLLPRSCSG